MKAAEARLSDTLVLIVDADQQRLVEWSESFKVSGYADPIVTADVEVAKVTMARQSIAATVLVISEDWAFERSLKMVESLVDPDYMVPVLVVGSRDSGSDGKLRLLEAGVRDYIELPVTPEELVRRVSGLAELNTLYHQACHENSLLRQMVHEQMRQLQSARVSMLQSAAGGDMGVEALLKGLRMSQSCYLLAKAMNLDHTICERLRLASPMQDIGSIAIPDRILQKDGLLSFEEREIIKMHVLAGDEILEAQAGEVPQMARLIARHHHERWDGHGYPEGLEGEGIPLVARIAAICDVFDALTTERPHKAAWSVDDAIGEIRHRAGTHFDPDIVPVFIGAIPSILDSRH